MELFSNVFSVMDLGYTEDQFPFIIAMRHYSKQPFYEDITMPDDFEPGTEARHFLSCIWLPGRLPPYAIKFLKMCMLVISNGNEVYDCNGKACTWGRTNDMASFSMHRYPGNSLRNLDQTIKQLRNAYDRFLDPCEYVNMMRQCRKRIRAIQYRQHFRNWNEDSLTEIFKDYVIKNFPFKPTLEFALRMEKLKVLPNKDRVLNLEGVIGAAFVDMLRFSGSFTREEANNFINIGILNRFFQLGRLIEVMNEFFGQVRHKQDKHSCRCKVGRFLK